MRIVFAEITDITHEAERVRIGGRCHQGPIRVGDVFTSVLAPPGDRSSVRLTVESIQLYGHDLNEIEASFTPLLTLSGHGIDLLRDGAALSNLGATPDPA